jgi:hypothetical protein
MWIDNAVSGLQVLGKSDLGVFCLLARLIPVFLCCFRPLGFLFQEPGNEFDYCC